MRLKEAKAYFKKHPCRDLSGRYYAYDIEGRVLGYVEYRRGIVVLRKTYKRTRKAKDIRKDS